ncbi:MAG: substrate-binding domain-containing protein [Anaerotignaceae bacterium]
MKKISGMIFSTVIMAAMFAGCGSTSSKEAAAPAQEAAPSQTQEAPKEEAKTFDGEITVVSREEGSGTRGAFIELLGIEQKNEAGEKVDLTSEEATITNSTSVVITTVAGDDTAIGYISLGSLNDTVKALKIDGAPASVEAIKDGSYKIARPFNIATSATASETAQDFIKFILSTEGQAVVEKAGYISAVEPSAFDGGKTSGKLTIAGSSSVTPVMEKIKEAYAAVNPNVEIEIQQSDSTTGMNSAISGICDIGMASRELKDSETGAGLKPIVMAIDGIAIVVNNNNPTDELAADDVKAVFMGETTQWSELAK